MFFYIYIQTFAVLLWRNAILKHGKYDTASEWYLIYSSSDTNLNASLDSSQNHVSRKQQNKQYFVLQVPDELYCTNAGLPSKPPQVATWACKQGIVLW